MNKNNKLIMYNKLHNLGYSDKQFQELIKYPKYMIKYAHKFELINTETNCEQIKQIMLGFKEGLGAFVQYYANNKYSAAHMRVLRLLLHIGLNTDYIEKYMNPNELNYKQFFVLGMILISSKELSIDAYIDFVKNANIEVDSLYNQFNNKISEFTHGSIAHWVIDEFDFEFYTSQISYQLRIKTECKKKEV